jgi:predicted DCC family thiol-disulfide oxidoreductase YuxK
MTKQALVLWDGQCGFCRRGIEWVERRNGNHLLRPMAYQQAPSPPMTPELRAACAQAMHVLTPDGRWLRGGRASLYILERIGFPALSRVLSLPPLVWGVEAGYWLVARNRGLASRILFRRRADG